jgi:hypothetical protein
MSTRTEIKNTLLLEFLSEFDTSIPISFANKNDFYLTSGVKVSKPSNSAYVKFYIMNNTTDQVSYGSENNRRFERSGIITYQVFIPSNTGTKVGDELCDSINSIFEGKRFDDIYCYRGEWEESGIQDNGFFMLSGTIYWVSDDII